ncbi:MAG: hypothetical protein PHY48_07850 [Candidatus Cloacimonetes bacterium]|nr:hypothetical protein [Candidatus Cloacimonadota bacterium]
MTARDLVLNFVRQFNKPFTAQTVAAMTAQNEADVETVLIELQENKTIRLVDLKEGIYVKIDRYNPKVCYNQKGDWQFDQGSATILLNLVEKGNYKSLRAIAKDMGRSRQWVFVYMEALASIGIIGMSGNTYIVITRDKLRDIGKHIDQGILGKMRHNYSSVHKLSIEAQVEERKLLSVLKKAESEQARLDHIAYKEAKKQEWMHILEQREKARALFQELIEHYSRKYQQ